MIGWDNSNDWLFRYVVLIKYFVKLRIKMLFLIKCIWSCKVIFDNYTKMTVIFFIKN